MNTENQNTESQGMGWLTGCCLFLTAVVACAVSFFIGISFGSEYANKAHYREEHFYVEQRISGDPAFANVEIRRGTNGRLELTGEVPTPNDYQRLRAEVLQAIGEHRTVDAMLGVKGAMGPGAGGSP